MNTYSERAAANHRRSYRYQRSAEVIIIYTQTAVSVSLFPLPTVLSCFTLLLVLEFELIMRQKKAKFRFHLKELPSLPPIGPKPHLMVSSDIVSLKNVAQKVRKQVLGRLFIRCNTSYTLCKAF